MAFFHPANPNAFGLRGLGAKKSGGVFTEHVVPRTPGQTNYVDSMRDHAMVVCIGPAGSGKTLLACESAVAALKSGSVQKIVLTRPIVPVDNEVHGFLPGDLDEKMHPWILPVLDAMALHFSPKEIDAFVHDGVVEIAPLAFMRGRTFKNAFVIADEMQNSSPTQMLMLATRIGENAKLVITGDLLQSDLGAENGLRDLVSRLRASHSRFPEIGLVELDAVDIQRSKLVSQILDLYATETIANETQTDMGSLSSGSLSEPVESGSLPEPLESGSLPEPFESGSLPEPFESGSLPEPLESGSLSDTLKAAVSYAAATAVAETVSTLCDAVDTAVHLNATGRHFMKQILQPEKDAWEEIEADDAALIPKRHMSKHLPKP